MGDADGMGELLMPPHIETKGYQLIVSIFEARITAPEYDLGSDIDPFIKVEFNNNSISTPHIDNTSNPEFDTNLYLPATFPSTADNIIVSLWDHEIIKSRKISS